MFENLSLQMRIIAEDMGYIANQMCLNHTFRKFFSSLFILYLSPSSSIIGAENSAPPGTGMSPYIAGIAPSVPPLEKNVLMLSINFLMAPVSCINFASMKIKVINNASSIVSAYN